MGNGVSVGCEVTPEFKDRIESIGDERDDNHNSETIRHLLREGAKQYGQTSFAQSLFKHLAIGFAMVALVGYLWAATVAGYERPLYLGVVWMVPSVAFLWLHQLWPGIRARFGSSADERASPSEA